MAGSRHSIYVDLIADVSGLRAGLNQAGGQLDGFAARSTPAKAGLLALGVAGGIAGAAVVKGLMAAAAEAIKFDAAMANVNSIAQMSGAELRATGDTLVSLSRTLPQSATVLAEGLYDVASSGFMGADGMKVLTAAATSASAGMSTTAVAARAITAVLNAYHLPAAQAADVSDTLFQTVKLGVITFEQLSHTIGEYVGSAQALGVSFPETGAAIATMTLNGVAAEQAGTALNGVLSKLIVPSTKLAPLFKSAGYESGTAAIKALGFAGTMNMIAKATGGSAEAMQGMFPDIQALQGALALTSNQGKIYNQVTGQIVDPTQRAGSAAAALAEQAKSAQFQLGILANTAMSVGLNAGRALMPFIAGAAAALSGLAIEGSSSREALAPLGMLFEALASTGGHLWQALLDIGTAYGGLAVNIGGIALGALGAALTVVAQAAAGVAVGVQFLTGTLAAHSTTALGLAITVAVLSGAFQALALAVLAPIGTAITVGYVAFASFILNTAHAIAQMSAVAVAGSVGVAALVLALSMLVVKGFQATTEGADRAREATSALFEGFAAGSAAYAGAADQATAYSDAQADVYNQMSTWERMTGAFSGRTWELKAASDAATKSAEEHSLAQERAHSVLLVTADLFGLTTDAVLELAAVNNIDLGSENITQTSAAMEALASATAATSLGSSTVAVALTQMQAPLTQSKEQIKAAAAEIKLFGDALRSFVDPLTAYTGLLDAKQAKENQSAQTAATAHGKTGVAWQTLVVTARVSVAEYLLELQKMVTAQLNWQINMTLLSAKVSADTLAELGKMGPAGAPLVAQLVNASAGELGKLEGLFSARAKAATDGVAAMWIAANPVLRQVAATLGQGMANDLAAQLNAGTITVAQIVARYGQTVVGGLAPYLASIGMERFQNDSFLQAFFRPEQFGPYIPGRAGGGLLSGPGGPKGDKILGLDKNSGLPTAWVSDREYVVNAQSTAAHLPLLQAINAGRLAAGGFVVPGPFRSAPSGPPISTLADRTMGVEYKVAVARAAQAAALQASRLAADGMGSASGLTVHAAAVREQIMDLFGARNIGGWRPQDAYGEHSSGRALDIMTGSDVQLGSRVASWLMSNQASLGVKWAIWQQAINTGSGWRGMEDRGSPTQNHRDHVHVFLSYADGGQVGSLGRPHNRDRGGPLLPGYTYNGTGRSELVVPDRPATTRAEPAARADRRIQVDNITMVNSRATATELARTLAWL